MSDMENGATQALIFKRPIDSERKEQLEKELQDDSSGGFLGKMKDKMDEKAEEMEQKHGSSR
jgi:hypothetical protein